MVWRELVVRHRSIPAVIQRGDRRQAKSLGRFGDAFRSAGVGLLLFSVVGTTIAGAEVAFFVTLLVAWLLFPVLVGVRSTLDAGCAFMLISIGVVVVVGLAQAGPVP